MKKNLLRVIAVFAFALCSTFALAGCFGGAKVTSIDLTQTFKTQYEIGETLDVSNGIIKVTYEDDTQKDVVVTESMVSGFNTQTTGQKTMIITYKGVTKTVPYTVTGPSLKENRYLWYYNSTTATEDELVIYYMYKQGGEYVFVSYSISNSNTITSSTPAIEWMKLQNSEYLENITSNNYPATATVSLDETNYYYYMSLSMFDLTITYKIYSLDNMVMIADETNLLEGFVRYIPAV